MTGRTRVFYCSTLYGAMSLAAGIDAGLFGDGDERRVLIVSDNGPTPEAYPSMSEAPGFAAVRDRFDDLVSWNELISPQHPSGWRPRAVETPMLVRYVADRLGLDGPPAELVLESIAVDPSRTIALLVTDCPITVYSDGLMSFGPTRSKLPLMVHGRIERLLYLPFVPGVAPVLLREYDVPAHPLPVEAFVKVIGSIPSTAAEPDAPLDALILGQYLSALEILTPREEAELHAGMLRALVAAGHRRIAFKPHPAAGPAHARELLDAARALDVTGLELEICTGSDPAELLFRDRRPALVVGCFSTALITARELFDLPVATMGVPRVLARLTPYQNSNRIPLTIVDATLPRLDPDGSIRTPTPVDVTQLIESVAHVMQPAALPQLRAGTEAFVAEHGEAPYFGAANLVKAGVYPPGLALRAKTRAAIYVGAKRRAELRTEGRRRAQVLTERVAASGALDAVRRRIPR